MKKTLSLVLTLLLFATGAAMAEQKIAVVDIPAVVAKSAQVQALKKEQQAKMQELEKWLQVAQTDVEKQQSKEGKEKLLKKYNADFAKKKEALAKNYQAQLQVIDKSITETITATAKAKGYNMVISKSVVVFGGDDITTEIQKAVK
ncbi:MAG: OmpH family outer membrane protein [Candidatus Gastranaerophilaceae bacterium]